MEDPELWYVYWNWYTYKQKINLTQQQNGMKKLNY